MRDSIQQNAIKDNSSANFKNIDYSFFSLLSQLINYKKIWKYFRKYAKISAFKVSIVNVSIDNTAQVREISIPLIWVSVLSLSASMLT